MSRIMQRDFYRDAREDLIVNHVHPGYVSTNMTRYLGHLKPEEGNWQPLTFVFNHNSPKAYPLYRLLFY